MARKKNNAPSLDEQRREEYSSIFSSVAESFGSRVFSTGDARADLVGLYLPALSLRWLLQATAFPFGRMLTFVAEEGTGKSAMLAEVCRWSFVHGGYGAIAVNEPKDSPVLRRSIWYHRPDWVDRSIVVPTQTQDDWQRFISTIMEPIHQGCEAGRRSTLSTPVVICVDPLTGSLMSETVGKITERGFAGRRFATEAGSIADYLRYWNRFLTTPSILAVTNHQKPATDYMGRPVKRQPGGYHPGFTASTVIEMSKAQRADIRLSDYNGLRVKFLCRKSCQGSSRNQIYAEMLWWRAKNPHTGRLDQFTAWDWHTASIELLFSFNDAKSGTKTLYKKIMEVCDLQLVNKSSRLAASKTLGVSSSSPVTFRELGRILESRPDVLEAIYPLLGIDVYPSFQLDDTTCVEQRVRPTFSPHPNVAAQYIEVSAMPHFDSGALDGGAAAFTPHGEELPDDSDLE